MGDVSRYLDGRWWVNLVREVLGWCAFDMGARRLLQPFEGQVYPARRVQLQPVSFNNSEKVQAIPPHCQGELDLSNAAVMTSITKCEQAASLNITFSTRRVWSAAGIAEEEEEENELAAYLPVRVRPATAWLSIVSGFAAFVLGRMDLPPQPLQFLSPISS
ncbi:uncharacterized protein TRIVIDRAFT_205041 [Trichoderma virens Gv29-8]|uniref:Uncharacterized protein n=1 Tax=Hypocrea virens (strain Gv29-8 / FGSC 10586) TaxID=413071 RepID=G9N5S7_HYPVG|nr:uncharacterized protein TRIVIDRAFT_205041 [Trichoderma virens Gv29-8]EHK18118.1 hypothetical protein TRIVIDRAFT_205041 [Trichoderma virens Gv29-8]